VLCVAVCCCGVLCSVVLFLAVDCTVMGSVAVCCSVLQCVAVCCSVLQCVAVCCSVLHPPQRTATHCNTWSTAAHYNTIQHTATVLSFKTQGSGAFPPRYGRWVSRFFGIKRDLKKRRIIGKREIQKNSTVRVYSELRVEARGCVVRDMSLSISSFRYGVATVSRIDKIIGLLCRIRSLV